MNANKLSNSFLSMHNAKSQKTIPASLLVMGLLSALPADAMIEAATEVASQEFAAPMQVAVATTAAAYNFNSNLLVGGSLSGASLERFNRPNIIDPGNYLVDIYVNNVLSVRKTVEFLVGDQGKVYPCLDDQLLIDSGVKPENISQITSTTTVTTTTTVNDQTKTSTAIKEPAKCYPVEQRISGATSTFLMSSLRLNITVPQALMIRNPRGYVNPENLDAGETMAFFNYDSNYYRYDTQSNNNDSAYLGVNSGINLGMWRLRYQGNYNYQKSSNAPNSTAHWNSSRTYAQRSLPNWQSELTIGQNYTGGNLFSSVGFRGISIATDDRMLPDSMNGYAPIVRGIALTNAKVVIRQAGHEIYQTTVAPGPFIIEDLYPTSYQGDLQVEVTEADGRVAHFTVPFSAVPESMRPGASRYAVSFGQVNQVANMQPFFADATYQRGLTNSLTGNVGVRLAADYQSVLAGAVMGTPVGALGLNTIYSMSKDINNEKLKGWRLATTYSYTYQPTSTTLSLAGYRYSTGGYRDLVDALGVRSAAQTGQIWSSATYQQRNQFVVNLNQNLGRYGQFYVSAAMNDYYAGKENDTQFQLGYSNNYRSINYNLSVSRQQTGLLLNSINGQPGFNNGLQNNATTNMVTLSVSVPLGTGANTSSLSSSVTSQSGGKNSYQTSLSGTIGEDQTTSYGLSTAYQQGSSVSANANVQKQFSAATVGASYSTGKDYWQAGANMRGALVAHSGGLTMGPYVGDTFGLIEAKGAEGALVRNGMGARIDSSGYAVIPYLTPYRYNEVSLDSDGINSNAELAGNQLRAAPYAGASVKFKFETTLGRAVLIKTTLPDGKLLPLGSNVYASDGANVGMVGQGGKIYARAANDQGLLTVKWGNDNELQCTIPYDLTDQKKTNEPLFRLNAACVPAA
ncbi:fimbria/pilus outer membrane usher protein [Solimicrobium silvestre]|uniref:P pilus assembly protein porin PapC n=1 Tax=Solimicrobium silvestre TaxID=2099400 RepID=A0A2S9H1C1_9BURK|nr:fimbria/pilus outer membrane usher protein [Solimicrobium silvestre]PRC93781.1 P pilus assembly protein porin PapC [Solimicrobium silvestre]